jgi:hypothetical protein
VRKWAGIAKKAEYSEAMLAAMRERFAKIRQAAA